MFFRKKKDKQDLTETTPPTVAADAVDVSVGRSEASANGEAGDTAPGGLSSEQLAERRAISKRMATAFGEITSVLMRAPQFKSVTLGDLERLIVPGVVSGQCLIIEAQSKTKGFSTPAAAALWALVSAEVDQRLSSDLEQPFSLHPNDWKSGDIPWLIVAAGDKRFVNVLIQRVQSDILRGKSLKMRVPGKDGKTIVRVLPASSVEQRPSS